MAKTKTHSRKNLKALYQYKDLTRKYDISTDWATTLFKELKSKQSVNNCSVNTQ